MVADCEKPLKLASLLCFRLDCRYTHRRKSLEVIRSMHPAETFTDIQDLSGLTEAALDQFLREYSAAHAENAEAIGLEGPTCCPEKLTRSLIVHLSQNGLDSIGRRMLPLVSVSPSYFLHLLDPELLCPESAKQVASYFRDADPLFFARLAKFAFGSESRLAANLLSRAMGLLEALGRSHSIVPWLKDLTNHMDERIRSKAVKILCGLRPDKELLEKHLHSEDARVRANAVEAMWHVSGPEAISIFQRATCDSHHRVVANGLVGLHYRKDPSAVMKMIELTSHPSPMFRVAMVWALGTVCDVRAVPTLHKLTSDPDASVSHMARRVLNAFDPRLVPAVRSSAQSLKAENPLTAVVESTSISCPLANSVPLLFVS